MGKSGDVLRWILTLIVLGVMVWWLYNIWLVHDVAPTKDDDGNVIVDAYARVKDTLAIVVPLVTLALGYWFGVKGADTAEQNAANAQDQAMAATAAAGLLAGNLTPEQYEAVIDKYPDILRTVPTLSSQGGKG